jgi:mannose-6-phosphate isomerase
VQIITGTVRSYPWGSRTAIPQFLGQPVDGAPQAEIWWGAHPAAPSHVDRQPLTELIAADPDGVVGAEAVEAFGPRLPYLLKVLAAEQPLSLQAHPSRTQAEAGFARQEAAGIHRDDPQRVFADDWPKPEMMVALGEVDALCGFREPAETYALFAQLGVEEATRLVAPLQSEGSDGLRTVFAQLLRLGEPEHALVGQVVAAAAEVTAADDALAAFARTATELDSFFPGDPGVLAALLLNRLRLAPGEALFLPAGNLHAYLRGFGVEIMANSDNTVRGGLTTKHIAVGELLDLLEFAPGRPPLVEVTTESPGVHRYLTPAPEFTLWRLEPPEDDCPVPGKGCGRVVLVTDGEINLEAEDEVLTLTRGQAAFALPGDDLRASGSGVAFVAGPGGLHYGDYRA